MDDQLLAEVEQLTSSTLAPEGCLLRLLPLLVGRQDGGMLTPLQQLALVWQARAPQLHST